MPTVPHLTPLHVHLLDLAAELMAAWHCITAGEARARLERIAVSLGISDALLASLIILGESRDRL